MPTTSGRPGHETPVGTFSVLWKARDDRSRPYNAPMPFSTYFVGNGIAFHEGSLVEQSHGCVHLSREAAAKHFETLRVGARVQVTVWECERFGSHLPRGSRRARGDSR
ncbi:L,D-transpeptidase family protein [Saccharothrix sp. BKS2]|uniref:L,D-transpeptidase n=1 Tax=Saccharothrix sp. BKS2 TaxID=3064400 RepID=UPI0039E9A980